MLHSLLLPCDRGHGTKKFHECFKSKEHFKEKMLPIPIIKEKQVL